MDPTPDSPEQPRPSRIARLRTQKERVTERVTTAAGQLEERRHRSSTIDSALRTLERDSEIGGGVLAAAVGFRVFLFLVPYVFVFVAGFGVASGASKKSASQAAHDAGIGGLIANSLGDFGHISFGQRIAFLVVGLLALGLAARALVKTLAVVHTLVWGTVERRKVGATKGAVLLVGLVTVAMVASVAVSWLRGRSFVAGLIGTILYLLVPLVMWLGASWLLPHAPDLEWPSLLPGAIVVGAGIGVLNLVTVYWISREVARRSDTYGALGAALAMLLWAYLLGRLVVAATVVNAALWRRRRDESAAPAEAG